MRSVTDVNGVKWRRANIRNIYLGNTEKRKAGCYGVNIRSYDTEVESSCGIRTYL